MGNFKKFSLKIYLPFKNGLIFAAVSLSARSTATSISPQHFKSASFCKGRTSLCCAKLCATSSKFAKKRIWEEKVWLETAISWHRLWEEEWRQEMKANIKVDFNLSHYCISLHLWMQCQNFDFNLNAKGSSKKFPMCR